VQNPYQPDHEKGGLVRAGKGELIPERGPWKKKAIFILRKI
jgi:hypothetical protein